MFNINEQLELLKSKHEYRDLKVIESYQDVKVKINNKTLHLLGSNNYLSLNNHPKINQISKDVVDAFGTGSGGSRLTTGTTSWHERLEHRITQFKGTESTLVFASGYMANLGVISSLTDKNWSVFSDKYNHASIVDGIQLSDAKLIRYKHCHLEDLEKRLSKSDSDYKMIITDSVFSMDGNIAPIKAISRLAKIYNAILVVDDAHGFGVLGTFGKGISEHLGLTDEIDLTIGTLSKAVPSSGGYVTGKKNCIDLIKNTARSFIFSTSLPPNVMAASCQSIDLIEQSTERRSELLSKVNYFVSGLNDNGFNIPERQTPIVPIIIGDSEITLKLQNCLLEEGIFIPAIRPPTVPKGTSRLRASINYNHTYEDLDFIIEKITKHTKLLGVYKELK